MTTTFAILFVIAIIVDVAYRKRISTRRREIIIKSYSELLDEKLKFFSGIASKVITPENVYERCKQNGLEKYVVIDKSGKATIRNILLKELKKPNRI